MEITLNPISTLGSIQDKPSLEVTQPKQSDIPLNISPDSITNLKNIIATTRFYGRSHMVSNQTINDVTFTKVNIDTATITANGITFDSTNKRFTVITPGVYQVNCCLNYQTTTDVKIYAALIYKNGTEVSRCFALPGAANSQGIAYSDIVNLATIGDYIELYTWHNSSATETVIGGSDRTFLSINNV